MLTVFVHLFTVQQNAGCYAIDQTRLSMMADTLLAQNSNSMRLMHGLNGGIFASESGYPSDPTIFYDNDPNLGEVYASMEGASIATYTGIGASSQPLNETLLGVNGSFGLYQMLFAHSNKVNRLHPFSYSRIRLPQSHIGALFVS